MPKTRLDSWKSVAEYLGRSPRTVQRWHAEHGLPVHHFGGEKGSVFAFASELDAWLRNFSDETSVHVSAVDEVLDGRRTHSSELAAIADKMWELRSEENLRTISGLYRKAIDHDPGNASALLSLANAMVLSALMGTMRGSAAYPRAAEALERALQLDPKSREARCTEAWLQMIDQRKWRQAREGFEEVLSAEPENSLALTGIALLQVAEGDLGGASRRLMDAWKRNTLVSSLSAFLCWVQYLAGDHEKALETVAQAQASGEGGAVSAGVEALALTQFGHMDTHIKRLEEMTREFPKSLIVLGALGHSYAASNRTDKALETLNGLQKRQDETAYPLALILVGMGEKRQAISWLATSYAEGSLWSLGFQFDPILEPLRGHPLFESLLRKMPFAG